MIGFVVPFVLALSFHAAQAGCMTAPTAPLRSLSELAGRDPWAVLSTTAHDETEHLEPMARGWRQAARAEALDILSRPADARQTARLILESNLPQSAHLRTELLARFAMNSFHDDEISRTMPIVVAARHRGIPGSAEDACLQIAIGEMERLRGSPEQAVVALTQVYRRTSSPSLREQHYIAAEKLSRVLDQAGDHTGAINLLDEAVEWNRAHGRTIALSTDLYFLGMFDLARRAYREALSNFEQSRALEAGRSDPIGEAFLALQTCAAWVELGVPARAEALCRRADSLFDRYHDTARGQAQLLLARIAFARGDWRQAKALLSALLARRDALLSTAARPQAYKLSSEVNDRLGETRAAYLDLKSYVRAKDQQQKTEQEEQTAVLRASFNADRAAAHNRELQQRLSFASERERAQEQRYSSLVFSASGGTLMLLLMLGMGLLHRRKLTHMANTDPLTGLFNRRYVSNLSDVGLPGHKRSDGILSIALVDLDHFKSVNDVHGHEVGDEILIGFAAAARNTLRSGEIVARWGGEEFIIVFPGTACAGAVAGLQRLSNKLKSGLLTKSGPLMVTFSAGVATGYGLSQLQRLLHEADGAVYRAKNAGRNRIEVTPNDIRTPPKECRRSRLAQEAAGLA